MTLIRFLHFLLTMIAVLKVASSSWAKPIITDCSVKSNGYNHIVTLHWILKNEDDFKNIREYWIYCNCSDYEMDYNKNKVSGLCKWPCHYSFSLPVDTCIDKCSCQVYGRPRWYYDSLNSTYWSERCNFTIGPLAPRAAPHITEVTKVNKKRLIHFFFELPKPLQKLYCDSNNVKSLSINVTQESGGLCHHVNGGNNVQKINYFTYKSTFQFDNCKILDFWSPSYLSISVHNSKDASPFSSPYTIRGAINSDIEAGSYTLHYENVTNSSASFFWVLENPLPSMLKSGFINGSQYNLMLFDGTFIKKNTTKDVVFTLNDLTPGEEYSICVTLITTDSNSWSPWPSCMNFITKQGLSDDLADEDEGDNNKNIFWFLFTAASGLFIIAILISVLCLRAYCKKPDKVTADERNPVMDDIIMSSHVPTIPAMGPGDSDIESLSQVATSNENDGSSFQGEYVHIKDISSDINLVTT